MLLSSFRHFNPARRPWRWKTGIVFFVLMLDCITHVMADCPSLCECKWKRSKDSVICINASLTLIPTKLDALTQVLDLTENPLGHVGRDVFLKADLLNLQKVYLAKCKIKTMDRYAFRKLKNLVELDLSNNLLPAIPSHVFDTISSLRELKLNGNPIQRVLNDAFIHVPQLVRLELSDCRIGTVEAKAFYGVDQTLEWLKLDRNRLVDVKSLTLTSMRNLHGLELAGNPWNCSCGIRPLREWMLRQNIPYSVPPVCWYPERLAGKSWARLELDEFACVPKIVAPQAIITGVEGRNVTMSCQVGGIPEPNVRWLWRNRVIANLSGVPYSNGRKLYVVQFTGLASNLTILSADVQDAGIYICSAENKAGKVEASVTLAIHRRPPDTAISGRVLVASIVVAALFVLASCLVVLCVCSVRRRQHNGRWQTPNTIRNRDDSYEKMEMNHKLPTVTNHTGNTDVMTVDSLLSSNTLEVAVVGPMKNKRRGQYRGVPSMDTDAVEVDDEEEGGYEDEMETPTPTMMVSRNEAAVGWGELRSPNERKSYHRSSNMEGRSGRPMKGSTDLHIPRASEYLDHRSELMTPEKQTAFLDGPEFPLPVTQNHPERNYGNGGGISGGGISGGGGVSTISTNYLSDIAPPVVHHHVMRKQMVGNNGGSLYTTTLPGTDQRSTRRKHDKNYPDLLEISPYSLNGASTSLSVGVSSSVDSPYCTLPRRSQGFERGRGVRSRHFRGDSQSPLLPDSRYGSSGGEGSSGSNSSIRRSSIDAYLSPYHPISTVHKQSNNNQRSSSSLNLASTAIQFSESAGLRSRKNPSLPSSPAHEDHSATPLLNLINSEHLSSRTNEFLRENMYPSPTSSSSTAPSIAPSTAAYTYDYHATQLERFLEEYRSLQEQLSKMKETCENIRPNDARPVESTRYESLLYNSTAMPLTPSGSEDGNPKSILKKPTTISVTVTSASSSIGRDTSPLTNAAAMNYGTDLSPYWLPRKTLFRRFSGGDMFQS